MMVKAVCMVCIACYIGFVDAQVDLQQTSRTPVCPGGNVTFTCIVTASQGQSPLLSWSNPSNSQDQYTYLSSSTVTHNATLCVGGFSLELIGIQNLSIVSTATLTEVTIDDDGDKEISCSFGSTRETGNITLSAAPKPPVNVKLQDVSVNSVQLIWSPPPTANSSCPPVTYSITIKTANLSLNSALTNTDNITNATNKTMYNVTQGLYYSFTVAGVDAGGRVGDNSLPSNLTFDTPLKVVELSGKSAGSKIVILWKPPSPSSRPCVMSYKILHNTTGENVVNHTRHEMFSVDGVPSGLYQFTVLAVNILGDGMEDSVQEEVTTEDSSVNTTSSQPSNGDNDTVIIFSLIGAVMFIIVTAVFLILLYFLLKLELLASPPMNNKSGYSDSDQLDKSKQHYTEEDLPHCNNSSFELGAIQCDSQYSVITCDEQEIQLRR